MYISRPLILEVLANAVSSCDLKIDGSGSHSVTQDSHQVSTCEFGSRLSLLQDMKIRARSAFPPRIPGKDRRDENVSRRPWHSESGSVAGVTLKNHQNRSCHGLVGGKQEISSLVHHCDILESWSDQEGKEQNGSTTSKRLHLVFCQMDLL